MVDEPAAADQGKRARARDALVAAAAGHMPDAGGAGGSGGGATAAGGGGGGSTNAAAWRVHKQSAVQQPEAVLQGDGLTQSLDQFKAGVSCMQVRGRL